MKKYRVLAAAMALCLTGCSFFNNSTTEEKSSQISAGEYSCEVQLTGGSGKATVESPAKVVVEDSGKTVELVWSSSNYDYMVVNDVRYDNEAAVDEHSVFTIPFNEFDTAFSVIGDTTAMSTPHEIEYELTVFSPGKSAADTKETGAENESTDEKVDLGALTFVSSMELKYAKEFSIDYYKDSKDNNYGFITINGNGGKQYFLKPIDGFDEDSLKGISENVIVLKNIDKTYLVSTAVMDFILNIDGLSQIRFSGTKASDWYLPKASKAIKKGQILYAGKYSAPDYELLVSEGCNFAIENTMIYHNPEAKEKLQELEIPVLVETSSYESTPLGRLEWIKMYGFLYGKDKEACDVFEKQCKRVKQVSDLEETGKKVAFFSINSNGQIVVRKSGDYITSMIDLAGGNYVPKGLSDSENALSTMKITMEDFYIGAIDADVLIYNSTIEGEIKSIDELVAKAPSMADFKAVKEGQVYCLTEGYFQKTSSVAEFIEELHNILMDNYKKGECFYKLKE